ncbi:alpha/beta fold hydrolase [Pseudobacteriovorax antillogorgiicola]|uniref:Pimeloyl-ACP methyl ester carboxylesterase n=1 Tax=Pseudobacteriovorax antillogorgiicola TaxID=1513793 RepID=A0A1Y6BFE7_9BACT|nr:alpha/beta hydrolase [Pseudobacteriovorax antillogorgiicola]TCS56483.1 pimeloyl-ACP methyl ester carboxylesterase [Pseudobacteriovorax antillogorgiicola]SMF04924.1 Pimeloyl-ACP methyl ester carboxylesterase [Pseudobacteriovorax antillogorgiicola]
MPRFASFDHQRLFYRDIGQGQPCVLIHGFSLDSRQWLPYITPLTHRFRFLLIDMRGHGRSKSVHFEGRDVMDVAAQDIKHLINHIACDHVILGGYSLGSAASLSYLQAFGFDKVVRYLNIDFSPKSDHTESWGYGLNHKLVDAVDEFRADCDTLFRDGYDRSQGFDELPRYFLDSYTVLFHQLVVNLLPQRQAKQIFHRLDRKHILAYCRSLAPHWSVTVDLVYALTQGFDFRPIINGSPIPMEFFVGQRSEFFHPHGSLAMADDAMVTVFKKSGHGLLFTEPLKFFRCFKRFLEGKPSQESVTQKHLGFAS